MSIILPPWYILAKEEHGQTEIAGPQHNQRIFQYHEVTTLRAKDDETPWCSSFINWCLGKSDFPITKSAAARSWVNYGQEVAKNDLKIGDIVVFKRGNNNWQGHVAFYAGQRRRYKMDDQILCLGGNQKNKVCYQWYSVSKLIAIRRPKGYIAPKEAASTNVKPLVKSKTLQGATMVGAGELLDKNLPAIIDRIETAVTKIESATHSATQAVSTGTKLIAQLEPIIPVVKTGAIGLIAIGLGLIIYARIADRFKGRN